MKMKFGLFLATMISTAVIAQVATNEPTPATIPATPVAPTPAAVTPPDANATATTNAPAAKKPKKKRTVKKKTTSEPAIVAVPLVTNELAEPLQNNVNVRGQAHINSEVMGHLKKGDTVTVEEIVTLKHPKTDEPARWARISLPTNIHVWINARYIDVANELVSARKLNLRTGPGENYSVIGMLKKGDPIKQVGTKGDWTEIEPPTNSFGFVAAHLLTHVEAPAPVVPPIVANPTPAPTPTPVENNPAINPASGTPGTGAPATPPVATTPVPTVPVAPAQPAVEEPLPERIVEREGIVGGTVSIQAPSHYELRSLDNGEVIDYLYTPSTNVQLKLYKGLTVHVTGPEELDERWPNTPVLTIRKIQVVKD